MERYVCIHGHFYQPPRENPWLEAIELQDSAYPFHDWNERITDECYRPNAASRILDEEGWITRITNNYSRISFNFGPTLLSWLEDHEPDVYAAILEADRDSARRHGGHGSAIAQVYGHLILPLANDRDRRTQVRWGVRDFEHRFGRRPEGMWLSETAADTASLEALAEQGIKFTILAPRQARRYRESSGKGGKWIDCENGGIDPRVPYLCKLPSGRSICIFFYDGPISQAIAFERLLNSGEAFAHRLTDAFDENGTPHQLANIGTDGESYGHHHRHGDMALAVALETLESEGLARLTNYGEFLEQFPPSREVEIHEPSSWSCYHGVERWRSDCGCSTGGHSEWNQAWRQPLREALDWLRDRLAPLYEEHGSKLLRDPWAARDDYIDVVLDRSPHRLEAFFRTHSPQALDEAQITRALKLLELQRHAMLMYTSCGWFFDELSGIETVQVVHYAARAIQLAEELFEESIEPGFLDRLEKAQSNIPEQGDGRRIYNRYVKPAIIDLPKVGAHYAVSSLFEDYPDRTRIYCYDVESLSVHRLTAGGVRTHIGRARVTSRITLESQEISYAVLHLAGHVVNGGARAFTEPDRFEELLSQAREAFDRADYNALLHLIESAFGSANYSLGTLFRDQQRAVAERVLESTVAGVEAVYRQVYQNHGSLVHFLNTLRIPPPAALRFPMDLVANSDLRRAIDADPPNIAHIRELLEGTGRSGIQLDAETLSFAMEHALMRSADALLHSPRDVEVIDRLRALAEIANEFPFEVDLAPAQNALWTLAQREGGIDGSDAKPWHAALSELAAALRIRIP